MQLPADNTFLSINFKPSQGLPTGRIVKISQLRIHTPRNQYFSFTKPCLQNFSKVLFGQIILACNMWKNCSDGWSKLGEVSIYETAKWHFWKPLTEKLGFFLLKKHFAEKILGELFRWTYSSDTCRLLWGKIVAIHGLRCWTYSPGNSSLPLIKVIGKISFRTFFSAELIKILFA